MMPTQNRLLLYDTITGLSVIAAVAATIFSLTHGITDVYPFLYLLPIILFVSVHPDRGVIFSLLLSAVFIILVYSIGFSYPKLIAVSTAWFVILVTIGVVTSSYAGGLRREVRKYQTIFENSQAGILTFDCRSLLIREINEKCARMLRYERADLLDRDLSVIIPTSAERDRFLEQVRTKSLTGEVDLFFRTRDGTIRQFLVTATIVPNYTAICSAIDITERKIAESVIRKAKDELEERVRQRTDELLQANEELTTEIQERKRYEEAIRLANRKLSTLSNITRHDILNQLTALIMYLSFAKEITGDAAVKEHLEKVDQITQLILKQIQFTRDYQNIGTLAPQWQDVRSLIEKAVADIQTGDVVIGIGFNNVEIYADMLLEKVFFNLVDNALRHGGTLSRIRFFLRRDTDQLAIVCEDDGIGIPSHAKEKIFRREYYRNTGYGLFFVTEILGITGITIRETGEEGKGARFEIIIPAGKFRFIGQNNG